MANKEALTDNTTPQPNCAICKWLRSSIFDWCMAQGGTLLPRAYDTPACRKLFAVKKT